MQQLSIHSEDNKSLDRGEMALRTYLEEELN